MKPHRKRKHDASAFERHEETDKHIKAAESLGIDTRRTSAVDMSIQSLVTDVISPPTPDQDHQQPPPITATNAPPLVKKSMSDATWECFLQIALLPSTLLGLGRDGVRKMVARFKMDDHRQSLQALIMLCTPNPDIVPSVVSNRPSHEKFVQLYLQLDDLGLFDE
ncbi:hypothetical protein DYB32_006878 [Aphanomyces invadans]|uniref:Uncharacterized protein n=1 Tax=Aphanomyces invadans TaxID=157072 RepID=A0A3R6Z172_9STRA|nr:hypothetical protein DYB32_006878 [Aphanomyces invadans]